MAEGLVLCALDASTTLVQHACRAYSKIVTHDLSQLRAKLNQLHAELAGLQNVDPPAREHLEQTLSEIEAALEQMAAQPGSVPEAEEGLISRLTVATRNFEEEHPTFAGLLGSVIDTLGRMGI